MTPEEAQKLEEALEKTRKTIENLHDESTYLFSGMGRGWDNFTNSVLQFKPFDFGSMLRPRETINATNIVLGSLTKIEDKHKALQNLIASSNREVSVYTKTLTFLTGLQAKAQTTTPKEKGGAIVPVVDSPSPPPSPPVEWVNEFGNSVQGATLGVNLFTESLMRGLGFTPEGQPRLPPEPPLDVGEATIVDAIYDLTGEVQSLSLPGVRMASGGRIYGAGTSTSDSIPAMLSNGEFVVNADAAQRNMGFLEAINSGFKVPGFARGGPFPRTTRNPLIFPIQDILTDIKFAFQDLPLQAFDFLLNSISGLAGGLAAAGRGLVGVVSSIGNNLSQVANAFKTQGLGAAVKILAGGLQSFSLNLSNVIISGFTQLFASLLTLGLQGFNALWNGAVWLMTDGIMGMVSWISDFIKDSLDFIQDTAEAFLKTFNLFVPVVRDFANKVKEVITSGLGLEGAREAIKTRNAETVYAMRLSSIYNLEPNAAMAEAGGSREILERMGIDLGVTANELQDTLLNLHYLPMFSRENEALGGMQSDEALRRFSQLDIAMKEMSGGQLKFAETIKEVISGGLSAEDVMGMGGFGNIFQDVLAKYGGSFGNPEQRMNVLMTAMNEYYEAFNIEELFFRQNPDRIIESFKQRLFSPTQGMFGYLREFSEELPGLPPNGNNLIGALSKVLNSFIGPQGLLPIMVVKLANLFGFYTEKNDPITALGQMFLAISNYIDNIKRLPTLLDMVKTTVVDFAGFLGKMALKALDFVSNLLQDESFTDIPVIGDMFGLLSSKINKFINFMFGTDLPELDDAKEKELWDNLLDHIWNGLTNLFDFLGQKIREGFEGIAGDGGIVKIIDSMQDGWLKNILSFGTGIMGRIHNQANPNNPVALPGQQPGATAPSGEALEKYVSSVPERAGDAKRNAMIGAGIGTLTLVGLTIASGGTLIPILAAGAAGASAGAIAGGASPFVLPGYAEGYNINAIGNMVESMSQVLGMEAQFGNPLVGAINDSEAVVPQHLMEMILMTQRASLRRIIEMEQANPSINITNAIGEGRDIEGDMGGTTLLGESIGMTTDKITPQVTVTNNIIVEGIATDKVTEKIAIEVEDAIRELFQRIKLSAEAKA